MKKSIYIFILVFAVLISNLHLYQNNIYNVFAETSDDDMDDDDDDMDDDDDDDDDMDDDDDDTDDDDDDMDDDDDDTDDDDDDTDDDDDDTDDDDDKSSVNNNSNKLEKDSNTVVITTDKPSTIGSFKYDDDYIYSAYIETADGIKYLDLSVESDKINFLAKNNDKVNIVKVDSDKELDSYIPTYVNNEFIQYSNKKNNNEIFDYDGFVPNILGNFGGNVKGNNISAKVNYANPHDARYVKLFDPRDSQYIPTVKNQKSTYLCWSFSATSAAETLIGKKTNQKFDFSEANQAVSLSKLSVKGFERNLTDSGNFTMSMAYFTRGDGPVLESNDKFSNISSLKGFTKYENIATVNGFQKLNYSINNIKDAVKNYGSVVGAIYIDSVGKTSKNYNSNTGAYYLNDKNIVPNHAIQIVGWDNSYSKNNFNTVPSIDGAWIVKNSYGTDFGDNGYMYISYMDASIPKYIYAITDIKESSNYKKYIYDEFGEVGSITYNTKEVWFSNKFKTDGLEQLKEVSFSNPNENVKASIYVGKNHESLKLMLTENIVNKGFYTYALPNQIQVNGDFVVAVKFEGNSAVSIPIERNVKGYVNLATAKKGQSYVGNGKRWEDVTDKIKDGNVCVRATTESLKDDVKIFVDKKYVAPKDIKPQIKDNRVFVPIRLITESIGVDIKWNESTKTLTIDNKITHTIGSSVVKTSSGKVIDVGANSYIENGRTMVSVRLITEGLGYDVKWNGSSKEILITTN